MKTVASILVKEGVVGFGLGHGMVTAVDGANSHSGTPAGKAR